MLEIKQKIVECLKSQSLPAAYMDVLGPLYDVSTNSFPIQESTHWDYKRDFPFSFSDDYFGGIVRIICAFHNTYGGLLIFGVHDTERTPGHNSVKINIERLNNVLRQVLSSSIEVIHRRYCLGEAEDVAKAVDLLLVPKRPMGVAPVQLRADIGRYTKGVIWMRSAHEVIEPTTRQLPFLYSPRDGYGVAEDDPGAEIPSALPPSPATLNDFIGRRDALDRLYQWLLMDDEPRVFLYGKGGSGKSTIAYEFAKAIAETAGRVPTNQGRPIDYVIYLAAKRRALDPVTAKIVNLSSYDFTTPEELSRAVLELCEWLSLEQVAALPPDQLIQNFGNLIDTLQLFLVIDDIDTLTTAGVDPGMDLLYRLMSKSRAGGKVLYTLRNAPSQSLLNSIEVPGLDVQREYPEFVFTCCKQFRVPEPDEALIRGTIAEISERRPLAIEVIIGLRRTAGSYHDAIKLFQTHAGREARRYLFQREYDALSPDNKSRLFLAALSLFERQAKISELESVLQFTTEQIRDCISETLEMFLHTDETSEGNTLYSLGQATELFIKEVSPNLTNYEKLRASVKYFKSPFLPKNAQIAQIRFQVHDLMRRGELKLAHEYMMRSDWSPIVAEHPEFNMLKGRICAKLEFPKYEDARKHFRFAVEHNCNDVQGMRDWYWMERNSQYNLSHALAACDYVINGKQFARKAKAEFFGKKGQVLAKMGQTALFGDPEISFRYQRQAINCFLEAYMLGNREQGMDPDRMQSEIHDSIRYLLISANRMSGSGREDLALQVVDFMKEHAKLAKYEFDIATGPLVQFAAILSKAAEGNAAASSRSLLFKLLPTMERAGGIRFQIEANRLEVTKAIKEAIAKLRS